MRSYCRGRIVLAGTAACLALAMASAAWAQPYSFASFTFDQQDSPDIVAHLASGTFSGAIVTAAANAGPSIGSGFPSDRSGFDDGRTLGRLIGLYGSGSRGINLPRGDNGTLARSGFVLSWSGGRKLPNESGDDFVVYESASNATSPEGFMVQVYNVTSATWSDWYYEPADTFQLYVGDPTVGAHATGFDLSDFGLGNGDEIDRIRLVNLTDEDRMLNVSRVGTVLPEDNGSTSTFTPDPGPLAGYSTYGASSLDPDPLYVGALHTAVAAACGNSVVDAGAGEQCDPGVDVADDCCTASCLFEGNGTACDDGLYCTLTDSCSAGVCTGPARDCSDANPCTADSCDDGSTSCINDPGPQNGAPCDDATFCTVDDTCNVGTCSGSPHPCGDSNPCTADSCDMGSDTCVHDGAPLEGTACDDADSCTDATTCSSSTCTGGSPILVCGDANLCTPEACDDGNSLELDGCSSACQVEAVQSKSQSNCLKALNVAGDKVASTQAKLAGICLNAASKDSVFDAQTCLTADSRGQVTRRSEKTGDVAAERCTVVPSFGETDPNTINAAAITETLGLVADLFGTNLDAAVILRSNDKYGALCQEAILAGAQAWASKARRLFILCKKNGLLANTLRSASGLEGCFESVLGDPSGKLNRTSNRMAKAVDGPCASTDLATAFPGVCSGAVDLAACVTTRAACRSCRALNGFDALNEDCDLFDDGISNASCP